jgi:inorganic pyrophosphatase
MSLNLVPAGKHLPDEINVIIEVPAHSDPVKYEVDHESGAIMVDRFMSAAMFYPCNYGYIPNTLADDGDPLDVLVHTPHTVVSGCVIRCRPVGILQMSDEAGEDAKLIAVPVDKLSPLYKDVKEATDLPPLLIQQITHFFEHYKDLEDGKWVKVDGWGTASDARKAIVDSVELFEKNKDH